MTMHLAQGLTTLNTKKPKKKKLTQSQLQKMEIDWRRYNKDCRRKHLHDLQFNTFEEYVDYIQGNPRKRNKEEKEFKPYAPSKPYVRNTESYPSIKTSDSIPGAGYAPKKEPIKYTGDLIVGIATMHKSNAVPVMRGTKQAEDIAKMRR